MGDAPEKKIELATFSGAEVTDKGMTIVPDYEGVEVEGDDSGTFNPQNRTKDGWGLPAVLGRLQPH